MGSIKDRSGMDLTEAEVIKKRWQEYTEELYKKDLYNLQAFFGLYNFIVNTIKRVLFLPPSDAYVRSFVYLLYTLIKLYYTKALSYQALSLAPDWILLLREPRILVYSRDSTTTFHLSLLAVLWNSAFRCLYLSLSPLLFTSLLFPAKSYSDSLSGSVTHLIM